MTEKNSKVRGTRQSWQIGGSQIIGYLRHERACSYKTDQSSSKEQQKNSEKKEKVLLLANQNGKIKTLLVNLNTHPCQPYLRNIAESIFLCLAPENQSKLFNKNSKKGGEESPFLSS